MDDGTFSYITVAFTQFYYICTYDKWYNVISLITLEIHYFLVEIQFLSLLYLFLTKLVIKLIKINILRSRNIEIERYVCFYYKKQAPVFVR